MPRPYRGRFVDPDKLRLQLAGWRAWQLERQAQAKRRQAQEEVRRLEEAEQQALQADPLRAAFQRRWR